MSFKTSEAAGYQSHYVDVDGLLTHYLESGNGRPLVLVHGGGAGADGWGNWSSCIARFATNFRVIVPDMPGFGRSAKPSPAVYPYDQASRNRHLAGFLTALNLRDVDLIGNSMGGATSLGLVIDHPEKVRRLVLMGSAGLAISNPNPELRARLTSYDHTHDGMRRLMRALGGPHFPIDEEMVAYRYALVSTPEARAAMDAVRGGKLTYDDAKISGVKTPTLVVGGKEDQVAVLARTYGYLELLPNSWGFVLPHVHHWVMMEAPEAFVAITTAFFNDQIFKVAV
ncbi:Alpha/beta hydrolase [Caballeronia arvi]|uniref:Alpha/beta hydrolase n=1 Tax=Caballeronia arvi TaxID=1777135 RepID=A0A158KID3_9BURK|nr:alpha/beta hydrolase [Caballeronia arvi]SAL80804.1 Alpha/beta hydrolase [Caballeronia arvi]